MQQVERGGRREERPTQSNNYSGDKQGVGVLLLRAETNNINIMMMMTDTISFSPDQTLFQSSLVRLQQYRNIGRSWHHYSCRQTGERYCQPGSGPKISQWRIIRKLMNHSTRNVCSFSFISAKHEREEYVYSVLGMQQQCCSGTGQHLSTNSMELCLGL